MNQKADCLVTKPQAGNRNILKVSLHGNYDSKMNAVTVEVKTIILTLLPATNEVNETGTFLFSSNSRKCIV